MRSRLFLLFIIEEKITFKNSKNKKLNVCFANLETTAQKYVMYWRAAF